MEQKTAQMMTDLNKDFFEFVYLPRTKSSVSPILTPLRSKHAETTFDQEWVKVLSGQITRTIRDFAPLLVRSKDAPGTAPVRMLDYACGNGVASWVRSCPLFQCTSRGLTPGPQAMAPYVDVIRGIDLAPGMVTQYNKRALEAGIPQDTISACQGDLLNPSESVSTPDLHDFDLAITTMALHHFSDPDAALNALVARLKPGGTVAVVDWATARDGPSWTERGGCEPVARHTIHEKSSEFLAWESLLPMLGRAGCDLTTAYYVVIGEKSHIPESATKKSGGVYVNAFLAFAKKRSE